MTVRSKRRFLNSTCFAAVILMTARQKHCFEKQHSPSRLVLAALVSVCAIQTAIPLPRRQLLRTLLNKSKPSAFLYTAHHHSLGITARPGFIRFIVPYFRQKQKEPSCDSSFCIEGWESIKIKLVSITKKPDSSDAYYYTPFF